GLSYTVELWHALATRLRDHTDVPMADASTQDAIAGMAADPWRLLADSPAGGSGPPGLATRRRHNSHKR
ncbi:MAG: hypothetical protein H7274_14195, partial [Rhodoferax sp.]|nr:hypothetical protein [Rhodoferax sp.]